MGQVPLSCLLQKCPGYSWMLTLPYIFFESSYGIPPNKQTNKTLLRFDWNCRESIDFFGQNRCLHEVFLPTSMVHSFIYVFVIMTSLIAVLSPLLSSFSMTIQAELGRDFRKYFPGPPVRTLQAWKTWPLENKSKSKVGTPVCFASLLTPTGTFKTPTCGLFSTL